MKVSVNWIRQFTGVELPVDELVHKIGVQLGAVEEVIDLGKKYEGIIVAKVVKCEKHTGADKLNVCKIDDGGVAKNVGRDQNGHVQVVCGAPNCRAGLTVAWLPPGVTVPVTADKDPLILEAREIRGEMSNGMLASASELAIGDDHSGIVELDDDLTAGTSFAEAYELNDYVIDIENKMFTHRPDCFGILGVAREIAGIQGIKFESPDWYRQPLGRIKPAKAKLGLEVRNESPRLVPRFAAIALSGIKIAPSPFIIQAYLARVGIKPINNVVDVTNYIMALTGQPLHAYDYDKLKSLDGRETATLVARTPKKGEELILLGDKKIQPLASDIVIASNNKLVGLGGVMGGKATEVDQNTTSIVLECASFDMYAIRRTSMTHGLFTDAVTRFNKGQSPLQNERVIEEAAIMIASLTGGQVASELFDKRAEINNPIAVHVRDDFINARLGIEHTAKEMAERLQNVEFDVKINGSTLAVTPPFWRTDIDIPEDVVEEVGRLFSYENLPLELPMKPAKPVSPDAKIRLKSRIRNILARFGANEVLTYSFVHGDLITKVGQDKDKAFRLSNALSPELQYYRMSLTPSLLDKVHANIKAGFEEFAIFEMGKGHVKDEFDKAEPDIPREFDNLALVYTALDSKQPGAAYFMAKHYLDTLAKNLGLELEYKPVENDPPYPAGKPFEPSRSALVYLKGSSKPIGMIGELKQSVKRTLKLPMLTAAFEIGLGEELGTGGKTYTQLSKYPSVQQDMSLKVPIDLAYGELFSFIQQNLNPPDQTVTDLTPVDIYKKGDNKHITLRLTISSYVKTLTSQEVNRILDDVAAKAATKLGTDRI